jgi:hypothetical protein
MIRKRLFLFLAVLVMASLACSLFGGAGSSGGETPSAPGDSGSTGSGTGPTEPAAPESPDSGPAGSGEFDTEFPLPADVQNFMKMGDNAINYQTSMKLPEVVDFYRDAFEKAGYDERDITTTIDDTTFSIVWDGHPSGQAVVVQGVDLGNGTTNVNVRLEDV